MENITRTTNVLDCGQSTVIIPRALFSPILLQSCSLLRESRLDNQFPIRIFQDGGRHGDSPPSWIWSNPK